MGRDMQVSDSVVIDVDAAMIYEQVADPTQMPRWSPENTGATTPASGRPLREGEVFDGANKRGGAPSAWSPRPSRDGGSRSTYARSVRASR
jgi:uncharacterized protein YndB with AHSA1/START domain